MDELKDVYGIEMTENDMKLKILGLLIKKLNEVNNGLDIITEYHLRKSLLELQQSLKWIINKIGG